MASEIEERAVVDDKRVGVLAALPFLRSRRSRNRRQRRPRRPCRADLRPGGWRATPNLVFPPNLTPIWLPSRAPELNPVENVWQHLRGNWLSNAVFETFNAIIDAACDAWRNLTARPEVIASIGMRRWAHVGVGQTL